MGAGPQILSGLGRRFVRKIEQSRNLDSTGEPYPLSDFVEHGQNQNSLIRSEWISQVAVS